jgi:UDP-GlcNAc:undecaprenyl-phosphate/decaprenyl-phosphate GlcNAc-1-phosphate transferase
MTPFILAFSIAWILALILTPVSQWLGRRMGLVDRPGGRRRHRGEISRLGGIGLYLPFALAVLATLLFPAALQPPRQDPNELIRLAGLLLGCTFMFLMGLLDDRRELKPLPQYVSQLAVSLLSIPFLIIIERVMNPFTNELLIFPVGVVVFLTVFWIMGMINTLNFLDGIDGLAAGVAGIVCVMLTIHMLREGQISVALLPLTLLGAILGFLPFNFAPARVFMGSTGSFFLGYAVAALSIISGAKMATILLIMGIPIIDVAWLIFSRWRAGQPIGAGDRRHLHHRLLDLGMSPRQIVLAYYLFCILFGALALTISNRIYKLIALVILGMITVVILVVVSRLEPKRPLDSVTDESSR